MFYMNNSRLLFPETKYPSFGWYGLMYHHGSYRVRARVPLLGGTRKDSLGRVRVKTQGRRGGAEGWRHTRLPPPRRPRPSPVLTPGRTKGSCVTWVVGHPRIIYELLARVISRRTKIHLDMGLKRSPVSTPDHE